MKRIIGILLVGLLGFLGCSDSDDGTSIFFGEAIPVAPYGIIALQRYLGNKRQFPFPM